MTIANGQQPPVDPALELWGFRKHFGGSIALDGVDLTIARAEVHALVGQNGSGKSTLVKILAGYHSPDGGHGEVYGEPLRLGGGQVAARRIRFVHQDLGLVESLDSVENVALGPGYDTRFGRISWRREVASVTTALRKLGYRFDVRRPVGDLSPSERVGVAIARSLRGWDYADGGGLLVLDEPTASMPAPEVERLFEVIHGVRESGTSILYVSHRFEEVFALADSVTVLRDGRVVTSRPMEGLEHDELVELLLGRRLAIEHYEPASTNTAERALEIDGLVGDVIDGVDLDLREGEVLGVAGVTGSGREELAKLIFGLSPLREGIMKVSGRPIRPTDPRSAITAGIGLVPADRHRHGLLLENRVYENMSLVDLAPFVRFGKIDRGLELADTDRWIEHLSIWPPDPEATIAALSGGNQQKVVVAKWLRVPLKVLVLEEPTQGVDVGSKADIHGHLRATASTGVGVLVISSDLEELAHLCDRVVVIVGGRVSIELSGAALNGENLNEAVLSAPSRQGVPGHE